MTVIVGEDKRTTAPYYRRKIQCPGHYLVSPKIDVYLRESVSELKGCSDIVEWGGRPRKIKKTRIMRDCLGNKMLDWKKIYALQKTGQVIQPWITASYAIENVYDPLSPICYTCKYRCKEGKDTIIESTIRRLRG